MKSLYLVAISCGVACTLAMAGTLTNSDPAALAAAIEAGGSLGLAFNETVRLEHTILIRTNTTVDATDRNVILDGRNTVRHFAITNGVTLRLVNLTLMNGCHFGADGETNQDGSPGSGGSIYNAGGRLELYRCNFVNNEAAGGNAGTGGHTTAGGDGFGGAIYSMDGAVAATNCIFADNSVRGGKTYLNFDGIWPLDGAAYGGAVFSTNGNLSFGGVAFTNNAAGVTSELSPVSGRAIGGAVANAEGTLLVRDAQFISNRAAGGNGSGMGGGLNQSGGNARLERTLFQSNRAIGGGMAPHSGTDASAGYGLGGAVSVELVVLEMDRCALVFNEAQGGPGTGGNGGWGLGGAIYHSGGPASLSTCTLAENTARHGDGREPGRGWGGAIFKASKFSDDLSLLNVTIAQNFASGGPAYIGIWPAGSGTSIYGGATLTNSILACEPGQTNVSGGVQIIDGGHNISSDASARLSLPSSHNDTDPMLGPLGDNGGPTPTIPLLPGSPAISAANDAVCPPVDQRGVARPKTSVL